MARDTAGTIRILGKARSYSDGAEDEIRTILEDAADRSDGSDELAGRMTDWPTTYHLSPSRAHLLRPFAIGSGCRVLEVGAGTGPITRSLGERGADVVALEGELLRAESIALRCADLDNVEVVCGALDDFEDPDGFDLVVIVGVLEYAGGGTPGHRVQLDFLRHAVQLLRPNGSLVLAIENQLGLKYLLGFAEDHLGEPWAGVEGYPGNPEVRTFCRATLGSLLQQSGLPAQRWFYPYPDYKLPRAILAGKIFDHPHGVELVDQLVGAPIRDLANPPTLFCDDRRAHRAFLEAGLGPEIANSFLVLAGRGEEELARFVDEGSLAWHFSGERRRRWRRSQVVSADGGTLSLRSNALHADETPADGWLSQTREKSAEFFAGRTFEQLALTACHRHDTDGLANVLRRWNEELLTHLEPGGGSDGPSHPFRPDGGRPALPSDFLDVGLSNFIDTGESVVFIDREWFAAGGVDADLVRYRALWYFALGLVTSGAAQPFEPDATVAAVTDRLWALAGLDPGPDLAQALLPAEARLQELVTGRPAETTEARLRELNLTSRIDEGTAKTLPVQRIRRDAAELGAMLEHMRTAADDAGRYQHRLESELQEAGRYQRRLEAELEKVKDIQSLFRDELGTAGGYQLELESRLDEAARYQQAIEAQLGDAERHQRALEAQLGEAGEYQRRLEAELESAQAHARAAQDDVQRLTAELEREREALTQRLDATAAEAGSLRAWREAFERRRVVRLWRRIQRMLN
jgi:SAM-dependent methyltransferase